MPLPAYMTQNPEVTPLKALENRLRRLGKNVSLIRQGCVVHIDGIATDAENGDVDRAIGIACQHADGYRLTLQARIPSIDANVVPSFESRGFQIVAEADEDDEQGAHYVLRRAAAA